MFDLLFNRNKLKLRYISFQIAPKKLSANLQSDTFRIFKGIKVPRYKLKHKQYQKTRTCIAQDGTLVDMIHSYNGRWASCRTYY